MSFEVWLTFVATATAIIIIPGPTALLVLSYAISQGRRVAVASAAGVALGDLIAMTLSLTGLGTLVLTSAKIFICFKWIGALYLIYLGIKLLKNAPAQRFTYSNELECLPASTVFKHTATVTALNPKSIAFFIAFVPQFIDPTAALPPQFITLIATFVVIATLSALSYAFLASSLREQFASTAALPILSGIGGVILVLLGIFTASLRRATT